MRNGGKFLNEVLFGLSPEWWRERATRASYVSVRKIILDRTDNEA